ncbi:MAG: MogA/MoaB family molybdenum cofactor biosynthesis protein [Verrucomicrobiota bacterium]
MQIRTGILTVSDRASRGEYPDAGGPALASAVAGLGWETAATALVPDDIAAIQAAVRRLMESGCNLVLATGGTGVAPRDVTPEALLGLGGRELPGFGEVMRRESIKITPHALLSRCLAVAVGRALVICLPGKPSGAVECLGFVSAAIPHGVEQLNHAGNHT